MNRFIDYIESSCAKLGNSHSAYRYKKKLLDEMTEKANELTRAGLKDEAVLCDLIAGECPDPEKGYAQFMKEIRRKRFLRTGLPVIGVAGILLIFIAYFALSAMTGAWSKTWLIIVGGVFSLVIFYFSVAIKEICAMRRLFHPIARVLIVACTVIISVFMFLYTVMMVPDMISWPILPAGIALALVADLIFSFVTKQKLRTISTFVYMPAIAAMLYIILSAYGVISWLTGWPVVLLGLVADFIYIIYIVMSNAKYFVYKQEVDE